MPRKTTTALLAFTLAPGAEPFVSPKARRRPPLRLNAGPAELWSGYLAALEADPLPVKMATAACVIGAGDATAQLIENERKKLPDAARVARWAFFGLVLQAPWNHVWQNVLEGALPATASPWTAVTFEKVALDQGLQAPAFTALVFFFFAALEGAGVDLLRVAHVLSSTIPNIISVPFNSHASSNMINQLSRPPRRRGRHR